MGKLFSTEIGSGALIPRELVRAGSGDPRLAIATPNSDNASRSVKPSDQAGSRVAIPTGAG
jgi:hypothetical protein